MNTPRMLLMVVAVLAFASGPTLSAVGNVAPRPRYAAIAFDYLVLFNADAIVPTVERVFPGRGRELTNLWRNRQFEYTWLRSITNRYVDFSAVTDDALVYAVHALKLENAITAS